MSLPFKQTPNSWPSNEEPTHFSSCSSGLVRPAETSLSTDFIVANVNVGPVLGQVVQPRRDRTEHGGLLMPQLGVDAAIVVLDPGLSLGCYSWRGGWTGTFKSQSFDHLLYMARVCFYPKPSGTPSYRSVEDLELLAKIHGFSDHLRLNFVPFFELLDQPLSVFPGGLDSDVITMDRSADSPRLFGV